MIHTAADFERLISTLQPSDGLIINEPIVASSEQSNTVGKALGLPTGAEIHLRTVDELISTLKLAGFINIRVEKCTRFTRAEIIVFLEKNSAAPNTKLESVADQVIDKVEMVRISVEKPSFHIGASVKLSLKPTAGESDTQTGVQFY